MRCAEDMFTLAGVSSPRLSPAGDMTLAMEIGFMEMFSSALPLACRAYPMSRDVIFSRIRGFPSVGDKK